MNRHTHIIVHKVYPVSIPKVKHNLILFLRFLLWHFSFTQLPALFSLFLLNKEQSLISGLYNSALTGRHVGLCTYVTER